MRLETKVELAMREIRLSIAQRVLDGQREIIRRADSSVLIESEMALAMREEELFAVENVAYAEEYADLIAQYRSTHTWLDDARKAFPDAKSESELLDAAMDEYVATSSEDGGQSAEDIACIPTSHMRAMAALSASSVGELGLFCALPGADVSVRLAYEAFRPGAVVAWRLKYGGRTIAECDAIDSADRMSRRASRPENAGAEGLAFSLH